MAHGDKVFLFLLKNTLQCCDLREMTGLSQGELKRRVCGCGLSRGRKDERRRRR